MIVAFKVIRATGLFFVFVAKKQTQKSYYALITFVEICITESNMVRLPISARQRSVALRFVEKSWTCRGKDDGKGETTKFFNRCNEGRLEAGGQEAK